MRTGILAAGIVLLATACSNPSASLVPRTNGTTAGSTSSGTSASSGSTSGGSTSSGGVSSTGTASTSSSGSSSGTTSSSGTGTTTGTAHFSCALGDGGLFADGITVSTGLVNAATWHPIDVGDLNGDGNLDIVVADMGSGDVAVLFGNGDGTFQKAAHSQVPSSYDAGYNDLGPTDVSIATLGSPLVASVAIWDDESASVLVESVLPTGEIEPASVIDGGRQGTWGYVQVDDFNDDGINDCAVVFGDGIRVLLGDGSGGYSSVFSWFGGGSCQGSCLGDFNDDGIPDALVLNAGYSVLLGQGDGTFASVGITSEVPALGSVWALGDLDEDGHLDALTYSPVGDGSYGVLLGRGDGTFAVGPTPTLTSSFPKILRELNGDGHLDYVGWIENLGGLVVALGNGDGTFQPSMTLSVIGGPSKIVVGDVNNDGHPDLIVSHALDSDVSVFLSNCR